MKPTPSGRVQAAAPGGAGYVDVGSWIDEIGAGGPRPGDSTSSLSGAYSGVTAGNLAALEDDDDRGPSSPAVRAAMAPAPSSSSSSPPAPSSDRRAAGPVNSSAPLAPTAESVEKQSNANAKVGVLVALVVVAAAGAAAWFTHLIPHP